VIVDNAIAVAQIVKYTDRMLWKFKKSPHLTTSSGPSASPSVGQESSSAAMDKVAVTGPAPVENVDIAATHPQGAYVIPRAYKVSGTIVTSRPVVVEGELSGRALVAPTVHVGTAGRLNIPTQAAIVTVSGSVEGPLSAREYVEVQKGGAIKADVEAGGLSILPGGVISGARLAIGPLRSRQ
jgi:cytoskeletal protein CcmA (bactofilin family)